MKIKLSIIIPVYNAEKYIKKCLDSILKQDYQNYEIIIINDGSVDNTKEILSEYKQNNIIIINNDNHGVSYSRNVGLEIAKGDYITFVDSDDYLVENSLNSIVDYIISHNCPDIIKFPFIFVNKKHISKYKFSIQSNMIYQKKQYNKKILPYIFNTFDMSGVIPSFFKKSIVKNIKFDEKIDYAEDMLFMAQALKESSSIIFGDIYYYNYYMNTNSATNIINFNKNVKQIKDNYIVFNKINKILEMNAENEIIERMRILINYKLVLFANKDYNNYVKNINQLYEEIALDSIIKKEKVTAKRMYFFMKIKYIKHMLKIFIIK